MDVGRVERELAELWRRSSSDERAVIRACMLNFVVACAPAGELVETTRTLAMVSERHPCRSLVIAPEPADAGSLDAWVSSNCHRGPGGAQVCSEQVTLEAGRDARRFVPGIVLQLLCEELPVFTWWRRPLDQADPLLRPLLLLSDRFVVDCDDSEDPASSLRTLSGIASDASFGGDVGDLAWSRLEPHREMLASFFDSPAERVHLDQVSRVSISIGGPEGSSSASGAYLAGWISSCLGRTIATEISCDESLEAGHVGSIRLDARGASSRVGFLIERLSPYRPVFRLSVEVAGSCPLPRIRKVAPLADVSALCEEIERDARDRVFEAALRAAAKIVAGT